MKTRKQQLYKKLNKITPYRVMKIKNEYGVEKGEFLIPHEEFTLNWLKNNNQGSTSFNTTALNQVGHKVSTEEVQAFEEFLLGDS